MQQWDRQPSLTWLLLTFAARELLSAASPRYRWGRFSPPNEWVGSRRNSIDPKDKLIAKQLKTMAQERQKNKASETATFGGMFKRGSMSVPADSAPGTVAPAQACREANSSGAGMDESQASAAEAPRYTSMQELENDLAKMKDAIAAAEYNGNRAEADMLRKRLTSVQTIVDKAREKAVQAARRKAMPDWSNPSEDDIKEAKEHGLDLTDETVRVCLRPHNVAMRTFKLATQVAAIVMVTGRAGAALRRGGRERIPSECQWRRGARTKRWRQPREFPMEACVASGHFCVRMPPLIFHVQFAEIVLWFIVHTCRCERSVCVSVLRSIYFLWTNDL